MDILGKNKLQNRADRASRNQGRPPVTQYYLPIEIREAVKAEARPVKASVSGFASALLIHALKEYKAGNIDLEPYLIDESKSPRYFYSWDFEKLIEELPNQ